MIFALSISAQEGSKFIEKTKHKFSKNEDLKIDKLKSKSQYKSFKHIKVNKLSKYLNRGYLEFSLPDQDEILVAKSKHVRGKDDDNYYWQGEIEDRGYFTLQKDETGIAGTIVIDNIGYSIINISKNKSVIAQIEMTEAGGCGVNIKEDSKNELNQMNIPSFRSCSSKEVSILVLYTTNAANLLNPTTTANQVINNLNTIALNSGIKKDVSFKLTDVRLLDFFNLNNDIDLAWDQLKSSAAAQNLRQLTGSDVVLYLTKNNFSDGFGKSKINASHSEAYSIIEIDKAMDPHFLGGAHEVAHFFGCRHQRCTTSVVGACENKPPLWKPFGWQINGINITLMHGNDISSGGNPLFIMNANFSNPSVSVNVSGGSSLPTGTTYNNNAREVKNRATTIACFEDDADPTVIAGIIGPNYLTGGNYTWTEYHDSYNATSPFSFHWELSANGVNGWSTISTSSTYSANAASLPSYFVLKLTISSNNGAFDIAYLQVTNDDITMEREESTDRSIKDTTEEFNIFPNPVKNTLNISGIAGEISIYNSLGQKIQIIPDTNSDQKQIEVAHFRKGTYFIFDEVKSKMLKFIKL